MGTEYVIKLRITGGVCRYAQNRSKTFDGSLLVCRSSQAKRFKSIRQARLWADKSGLHSLGYLIRKFEIAKVYDNER